MKKTESAPRSPITRAKKKFNPRPNYNNQPSAYNNQSSATNPEPYPKKETAEESTGTNAAADAMKTARKIMAQTKNLGITKAMSGAATRIASMPRRAAQQASRMVSRAAAVPGIAVRSVARFAVNTANTSQQAARKISGFVARATARPLNTTQRAAQKTTLDPRSLKPAQAVKHVAKAPTTTVTKTTTKATEKPIKLVKKADKKTVNSAKKLANQPILSPFKTATPKPGMATIAFAAKKLKASVVQAAKKAQESARQFTGMRPK